MIFRGDTNSIKISDCALIMDLYIAEKPSLAKTLAEHIGKGQKTESRNGHIIGPTWIMTWCIGHLYELFDAGDYQSNWGSPWCIDVLPIIPEEFKYHPVERTADQLKIVHNLCTKASRVFHCGDPDREGQFLVDLVINHSSFNGQVFRVWPDDLSPVGLTKVFSKIKPNSDYRAISLSAQCRSNADWLVGINFTRLYTCIAQSKGYQGTISLGRVQTVTYALVYHRCIEIEMFKPIQHYSFEVKFSSPEGIYVGEWIIPDELKDANGYCLDLRIVETIAANVATGTGLIKDVAIERKTESSPLPFSLSQLQTFSSDKWGYSAKQVLNACQYLYEELKCTTYPRTDCSYLSEGDFAESKAIANIVTSTLNIDLAPLSANFTVKPRCYDNSKTTAHTGIIPTTVTPKFNQYDLLSERDKKHKGIGDKSVLENIYSAVAMRFLAQFLPKYEYQQTTVLTSVKGYEFRSKGKLVTALGWKSLLRDDSSKSKDTPQLPHVSRGQQVQVAAANTKELKTSAPEYFTEGTLIAAMANIARFVDDEKIKQKLKDTDGIGTEATRADAIEKIKNIGYIRTEGKKLMLTILGREIFPSIPSFFKTPAMTAIWESALQGIAESRLDHNAFNKNIVSWTETQISRLKDEKPDVQISIDDKYKCQTCSSVLIRKKGKFGDFWPCTNRDCKTSYRDFKRAPLYPLPGDGKPCSECLKAERNGVMTTKIRKEDRDKGIPSKAFLGCSLFPECKNVEW